MSAIARLFKNQIEGEIRFDQTSRILYSTDASIYQIEPTGVIIPKNRSDLVRTIQIAAQHKIPIIPRGGGTGLAGQAIGRGIVIDTSKYLNRIIEVNAKEKWAIVEPGVILDQLNNFIKPLKLFFAPDPATSSRATIGGMIANNSSGSHSVIYGKTIDHIISLDLILPNGDQITAQPISPDQLEKKKNDETLEAKIYREICRIADENADEIRKRFPRVMRRVAGYNLDEFVENAGSRDLSPYRHSDFNNCDNFNLAKIIVGSEGTLATIASAKINLVPTPKNTAVVAIHFDSLIDSMEAVNPILTHKPSAIELIDKSILDMTKNSIEYSRMRSFIDGDPKGILAVEFYGENDTELIEKIDRLESNLRDQNLGYSFVRCVSAIDQKRIWDVRKAGLGLLMGMKGDTKPATFIEDCAVDPVHLPTYFREFDRIITEHDTTATYYAHASVGLLHIRPMIDLKNRSDVEKMRSIAKHARDLMIKLGGTMSGEHGDGLSRSEWLESMFGEKIIKLFKKIKHLFDPDNLMNPGKIIDPPSMTENLRFDRNYKTEKIDTFFDFSKQNGITGAIEMCNGAGVCRKRSIGTMCPSYMATLDENDSTRGRANMLRSAISGGLKKLTDRKVYDTLDLCLECKACKSECPANVDLAKLKYEFLAHYYVKNGLPLRNWIFGNIAELSELACDFAPIKNFMMNTKIVKWFSDQFLGLDSHRSFPNFASETFEKWFNRRDRRLSSDRKVVLFHDTFMNFNYPEIGRSAVNVLEAIGYEVILPKKVCCGRPMISKGMLPKAIENAKQNIDQLIDFTDRNIPIVGCEASCVSALTDDYVELIRTDSAKRVAGNTMMIDQFLLQNLDRLQFNRNAKKILLHGHCHQKALWGVDSSEIVLRSNPNFSVQTIEAGCCGMAGSFGYEKEHYEISMQIGADRLFKTINDQSGDFEIAVCGVSCREQICHGTKKSARHVIEILADSIKETKNE